MASYPPSSHDILAAVAEFLRSDVLPVVDGFERFRIRVAAALVELAGRDASSRPERERGERRRLRALLGSDEVSLRELNRELKRRLRAGELSWREPDLWAHVKRTVALELAVDNPRWFRDADESSPRDG